MQSPEPSREELIRQIADILGKAHPKPPLGKQILSALFSVFIRSACVSYATYLGFLFLEKYSRDTLDGPTRSISNFEIGLAGLLGIYLGYRIFRRVYGDRLVPLAEMAKRMVLRLGVIVTTFLFWSSVFSLFGDSRGDSFWHILALMFILGSGYDFRLSPRPSQPQLQS